MPVFDIGNTAFTSVSSYRAYSSFNKPIKTVSVCQCSRIQVLGLVIAKGRQRYILNPGAPPGGSATILSDILNQTVCHYVEFWDSPN